MFKKNIISLMVSALLSTATHSATVYVSDIQFVAIREGLDNNTRAVERGLKSGTPLEVLEQENGYTKVKTPNGNEGWVADYFLSENIVVRDQLNSLKLQVREVEEEKKSTFNLLEESKLKNEELNNLNLSLQDENNALKKQIEDSAQLSKKAQEIVTQNEDVSYQIESLKQQANTAREQSEKLHDSKEQKWFMIGAVTLFSGLLLGLLIPMTRRNKNNSGSWF